MRPFAATSTEPSGVARMPTTGCPVGAACGGRHDDTGQGGGDEGEKGE